MKQYFAGLITGIFFIISAIAFMGAHNDIRNYGKYQFTFIVEKILMDKNLQLII